MQRGGEQVVLGLAWDDGQPLLRMRGRGDNESLLESVPGLRMNYRIEGEPERICLGHTPFRTSRSGFQDCARKPEDGKRRCERCSIVEATFAANLHHAHTRGSAELDPAVRDHLQQPNRLYLAAFRDGSIKVGTSTLSRSQKRLEEQGAWKARFMAETTNGIAVRSLEDMVTEVWAVPQAVRGSRKAKGFADPRSDAELDSILDETAQRVVELIARLPDDRVTPIPGPNGLGESWVHPNAGHPQVQRALAYPLSLTRGSHDLELITAVGQVCFARRRGGDDVFVIEPSPLFGIVLDFGEYGSDEIAIQDSLF